MKVVNRHHKLPPTPQDVYIGRGTPIGNPFTHLANTTAQYQVASREEAVEKYRQWLWDRIRKNDQQVMNFLRKLKEDSVLICYCDPNPCHGTVIVKAWTWLKSTGRI